MKAILIVLATAFITATPAHAYWTTDIGLNVKPGPYSAHDPWNRDLRRYPVRPRHGGSYARHGRVHVRYSGGGSLSSACWSAARQGGPCGCYAQSRLLGSESRLWNGHNLWLARTWRDVFRHVAAAPGTVAVFGNRHVAPVVAVNGDGTVTVDDSWNHAHRVSMRGLTFVDPHVAGQAVHNFKEKRFAYGGEKHYAVHRRYWRRSRYAGGWQ